MSIGRGAASPTFTSMYASFRSCMLASMFRKFISLIGSMSDAGSGLLPKFMVLPDPRPPNEQLPQPNQPLVPARQKISPALEGRYPFDTRRKLPLLMPPDHRSQLDGRQGERGRRESLGRMPINCISPELIDQILKKFRETPSFDPATFRATRHPPFQAQQRVNRIPALSTTWTQSSNFGCSSKATDTPASPKGLGRARNIASLPPSLPLSLSLPLTSHLPWAFSSKKMWWGMMMRGGVAALDA